MHIRLHRVTGGTALRSEAIEGDTNKLPEVGRYLLMTAPPVRVGYSSRIISTSPVTSYRDVPGGRQITTKSGSVYFIEVLGAKETNGTN